MDTPPVTLGPVEQRRLYVLTELLAGRLTTIEAALTLDLSIRHLKRIKHTTRLAVGEEVDLGAHRAGCRAFALGGSAEGGSRGIAAAEA